jgi:hypothetical protein
VRAAGVAIAARNAAQAVEVPSQRAGAPQHDVSA